MRYGPNNLLCFRTCVVQHSRGIQDLCVSPSSSNSSNSTRPRPQSLSLLLCFRSQSAVLSMLIRPKGGKVGGEEVRSEERRGVRKGVSHPLSSKTTLLILLILALFSEAAAGPIKVVYGGRL